MLMNTELVELVDQLIEFGYGDSLRLDSISNRLRNDESLYPSDQKYVDMLVSKYLYPHMDENENLKKPLGTLERKIQNVKKQYGRDDQSSMGENLSDLCPKCGSPVPRMFSFCSRCGAFHDEHNFIDVHKSEQKKEFASSKQFSQDKSMKPCIACNSRIFTKHEFCPICGAYQNEQGLKKSGERHSKKLTEKERRHKRNIKNIAISCIIIISIIAAYESLNIYSVSNLEFRSEGTPHFDTPTLGGDFKLDVCNPTFFPATYNNLGIGIDYKTSNVVTVSIFGGTILPKSASTVDGKIQFNAASLLGMFLTSLGSALSGGNPSFDPNQIHVSATLDAPIFGIIPFSIEKEYSINEFKDMFGNQTSHFDCK